MLVHAFLDHDHRFGAHRFKQIDKKRSLGVLQDFENPAIHLGAILRAVCDFVATFTLHRLGSGVIILGRFRPGNDLQLGLEDHGQQLKVHCPQDVEHRLFVALHQGRHPAMSLGRDEFITLPAVKVNETCPLFGCGKTQQLRQMLGTTLHGQQVDFLSRQLCDQLGTVGSIDQQSGLLTGILTTQDIDLRCERQL